ncbi:hypothetical protein [Rhodopirellula sp. MGV]|uniref:hypothetical protein n=1 Tax=Rhodopirellula sp. MGV TaxID=2023130 RepID=UPI000B9640CF|nr:hypothetical protein [Rhodopirellula sp. MGV]OYP34158.1 hypothetical protein CGZ80_16000 [Rhodopirellula sp. MGV]PNY33594.1 hypothetical protein C2E31_27725 [Rhodopirellula baltica]
MFFINRVPKQPSSQLPSRVIQAIAAGDYATACDALQAMSCTPKQRDVLGVCFIRAGRFQSAVELYKSMCLLHNTTMLRPGIEDSVKINYATAVLLAGRPSGALEILADVVNHSNDEELVLRTAIKEWERSLSFWQRLDWRLNRIQPPNTCVTINGTLGMLPSGLLESASSSRPESDAEQTPPPIAA